MSEVKRTSLVKTTVNTPFKIDFDWWKNSDNNWRVYLVNYLCPEHQVYFSDLTQEVLIDWIDPQTAEVQRVDGLQHVLVTHCAHLAGFVTANTTLIDAVFRTLLAHGNQALSPTQLSAEINRPAETILRTLTGAQVYKGIRPYHS